MKGIYKKILTIIAAFTLTLGTSVSALAAEVPIINDKATTVTEENIVMPRGNNYKRNQAVSSSKWTEIATSTDGFGCNVQISATYCTTINYVSVIMYSGNDIVWSETNCIPYNKTRVFKCGSDVTSIKVKCTSGGATVSASYTTKAEGIY